MDRKLTPAEAVLLLAPASATAGKCLQAGLLSLLGAERIAFERSANPFRQSALLLTMDRPGFEPLPRHLAAIEDALAGRGKDRLRSSEVLHALQKRFGYAFGRYVQNEVAPGLIERGLLRRTDSKLFGLFPRTKYQRSPSGDALARPLERLMLALDQLPSLIDSDPEQAVRLARSAGVLLVMSPRARKQIPKLRKLFADRTADFGQVTGYSLEDEGRGPGWDQLIEFGDMALAFDLPELLDGIDTVGDFTSGGDSSSSDGGGDGGG